MKTNRWIVKLAALILFFPFLFGCKTYMKLKYGVTQPKQETPAKLISFLEKYNFPTQNMYVFSDSAGYIQEMKNPTFSKYILSNMIFDHDGILLKRDTAQCQWSGYDKIKSLRIDSLYEKNDELRLTQLLEKIRPFGKSDIPGTELKNPDFTVVVTWAKFLGSYNYRLFVLDEAVNLNKTARIRLIWLNIDMQKSWSLTPGQKVAIN